MPCVFFPDQSSKMVGHRPVMMGKWKTIHSFPTTFRDWFYHYPLPHLPQPGPCFASGLLGGRAGSDTAPHAAVFTRPWVAVSVPIPGPRGRYVRRCEVLSCLQRHEDARRVSYGTWIWREQIKERQHVTTHESSRCLDPQHFKAPGQPQQGDPIWCVQMPSSQSFFYMHPERIWTYFALDWAWLEVT